MTQILSIESPQSNLNRARFASKDFYTFVDDLVARIQVLFVTEFNDFVSSGTGQMLIDIVAWACESLSFYIDRQASESYLATARTRRAVNRLARDRGYKMRAAVAASVDLSVNLTQVYAFDVTIPKGFQFKTSDGLVFESFNDVTFPAGEGPLSPARIVSCYEGVTYRQVFVGTGQKNQVFKIQTPVGTFVADGSAVVTVDFFPWAESDFITYDKTNQFEVDYNSEPSLLRFGDAVAGNVPATGADIRLSFVATHGAGGLVLGHTIQAVVTPLVVGFQTIPLTIDHDDPSSGGSDREAIDETKRKAPMFYSARNVAVTQDDYIGLSQAFTDPISGSVAIAQAFVALGADDDLALQALLANIRQIADDVVSDVTTRTTTIRSGMTAIEALRVDSDSKSGTITSKLSSVTSNLGSVRTNQDDIVGGSIRIDAQVTAMDTKISSITTDVTSQLTAADKAELQGYLTEINNQTSGINGDANGSLALLTTVEAAVSDADDANNVIAANMATMAPLIVGVGTILGEIDAVITADFQTAIDDQLQDIFDHVDSFLSADCKANLVQVPILTKDVDGFLVEPTIALMRALNSYLNARKEVTQTVEVVSGGPWLVPAVIVGRIGVIDGYVHSQVLANVSKAIDDILRDREFGADLHLSDLYTSIQPDPLSFVGGVDGVKYAILRITGPTNYLDTDGNLSVDKRHIVTKGTVTLTTEVAVM